MWAQLRIGKLLLSVLAAGTRVHGTSIGLQLDTKVWRDGRADEGGCLENNCGSDVTGGSNPSPSA